MSDDWFERLGRRAKEYVKRYNPEYVTWFMLTHCAGESRLVISQAGRLLNQEFSFTDRWDMEPCEELYKLDPMTWDVSPNGDPEWIFMLNRHEYFHKLLIAYRLTGNREYLVKLKWYLFHWIRANPITELGGVTTRAIDTGIRCMSWQHLLCHLIGEGLMDKDEAEEVLDSISRQYLYMRRVYLNKYTLSNWGVLQTAAVCHGYLWFGERLPGGGLREWAWEELERQLQLQVTPDGSHWEQSIMYHVEVLLVCMKLMNACLQAEETGGEPGPGGVKWLGRESEPGAAKGVEGEAEHGAVEEVWGESESGAAEVFGGREGPAPWRENGWLRLAVERMARYVLFAAAPDHYQTAQGDSDVTDVRDVLVKAAALTRDPGLRFGAYKTPDLDSAWTLGEQGLQAFWELKGERPHGLSYEAADTGNIYLRSSWEEDSHFTCLKCGPLGSSHGHADMTHISLYYKGLPFLIDSGRYSYVEEEPLRAALKSAQAHNVCVIDGESHGRPKGSWSYESFGEPFKNYYREEGPVHFAEMAYHGRLASGRSYLVSRRVFVVDQGIWLIVNDICCDGEHRAEEYYHLHHGVRVEGMGEDGRHFILEHRGARLNLWGAEGFSQIPSVMSEQYNTLADNICLVKETAFSERHSDWTCLAGEGVRMEMAPLYQSGSETPVSGDRALGIHFYMPEGDEWILVSLNRETFKGPKLYECQGIPLYAKAAAIHIRGGERRIYRLMI